MSTNPPGLMLPTVKSYTPGAGNPRDSAMMAQQQMNTKQANLNSSVGGYKKRKYRGGQSDVVVPQFQMQYTPQGGPGTNPNDQIKATSSTSMQSNAWAVNDNQATKMGGRRTRKGGKLWGCYSGGKKKSRKSHRKSRKHKRTRRH
jgi:hypothetical protein